MPKQGDLSAKHGFLFNMPNYILKNEESRKLISCIDQSDFDEMNAHCSGRERESVREMRSDARLENKPYKSKIVVIVACLKICRNLVLNFK